MSTAITPALLRAATGCTQERADLFAEHLAAACSHFAIDTPARLAAFLGQLGHESGSLRHVRELADGSAYEGRRDLGNIQPGDGPRYKGRGLIQITGRDNYRQAARQLQNVNAPDFEDFPHAVEEPKWACWTAANWWAAHGCNALADAGDIVGLGRLINRGNAKSKHPANGEADRIARTQRARDALGVPTLPRPAEPAAPVRPTTPPAAPAPERKSPMAAAASFAWGLASSLIDMFAPLAREKITKEVARHSDNPQVAEQVASAVIEGAKSLTGKADPIDAVAAVRADPEAVQQLELDALAVLDRLAPVLDKMHAWDKDAWAAEEASRQAAAARAQEDPNDQDPYLTQSIVRLVVGILVGGAVLTGFLAWQGTDVQVILGALLALVGAVGGKFQTRYDHRYGSSRGSGAKDVVLGTLAGRQGRQ